MNEPRFDPTMLFNPAMAWPEPQPHRYAHQTTYGTDMTSSPDPISYSADQYEIMRRDRDFHRSRADALGNELTRLRTENTALVDAVNGHLDTIHKDAEDLCEATRALGAKEMELREARGDAVTANRRRSELGAELHTAQVRIRKLEAEAQRLRDANTELHRQLSQRDTPPGSYLIRSPGVYYAYVDPEHGPGINLQVVKHEAKDTIFANVDMHRGWNWVGRDANGSPYIMAPNQQAQHALSNVVKVSGRGWVWVGMDPGKPGDDMTTVSWRYPAGDPSVRVEDTVKEAAQRIDRLEAWARQFGATTIDRRVALYGPDGCSMTGYTLVRQDIEPLDSMETKA